MVRLIIDSQSVEAEESWTVLEAAQYYGIDIPTLCYHEGLSPTSSCRLCVVEVIRGGRSRLTASCSMPVQEGIEVRTNSERVRKARSTERPPIPESNTPIGLSVYAGCFIAVDIGSAIAS